MTTSPKDLRQLHVLGIAGSLRQAPHNRALLRAAQEAAPEGTEFAFLDLPPIPLYHADVEAQADPEPVAALKAAIHKADAPLLATLEYNRSLPGVLKNALDWVSRLRGQSPLDGKPVAITGAPTGSFGTATAQSHLRLVCAATNMLTLNRPEVLVPRAHEKFHAEGRLVDERTRERLERLLQALREWVPRLG